MAFFFQTISKLANAYKLSRLGKKLLFRVIMFSSILTLTLTGGQLYFEFTRDMERINTIRGQIKKSFIKSIETSVWAFNEEQALTLLEGIVAFPSVTKAKISSDDGVKLVFEDSSKIKGDYFFNQNLYQPQNNKSHFSDRLIGVLEVEQSSLYAYENLRNRLLVVLLLNFIKTFLVAIFILFAFHDLISRHLIDISNFISGLSLSKTNKKLQLNRPKNPVSKKDDLDTFVDSFNQMSKVLHDSWLELEKSENRYRLLIDASLQGILIVDKELNCLYASKQVYSILDVEANHLITSISRFFSKETIDLLTNFFQKNNKQFPNMIEVELLTEEGRKKCVQVIIVVTTHENQPALQIVMNDISNIKEMQKKQKDYELQLIQNNKMTSIGTMVSGVAHEINNPNHLIKQNALILAETWDGFETVLKECFKDEPELLINNLSLTEIYELIPELIQDISQGSKSIEIIINDLKAFVRDEGSTEVELLNTNKILKDVVKLLRISISRKCNNFTLDIDPNTPDIWCYPQRLSQVFINLLINAIESLRNPADAIIIKSYFNEDVVTIHFIDEGIGIPKEDIANIFDAFFTTKVNTGGTGLGLSISQSIILQHHGVITMNTNKKVGSEFIVTLPINKKPMKITLGI